MLGVRRKEDDTRDGDAQADEAQAVDHKDGDAEAITGEEDDIYDGQGANHQPERASCQEAQPSESSGQLDVKQADGDVDSPQGDKVHKRALEEGLLKNANLAELNDHTGVRGILANCLDEVIHVKLAHGQGDL
ncbi:hypothetical protein K469DRAFT_786899 [Zopfia rhizophila CBS 207.26]|uniref:Uncharacterized protein n=1 Tax=Zopfia rhizophila CBS 207.26 TaxID=1314779 RepID=A0A6A6DXJ5_9PEZI|nr:hypothetical protein K469DRAFT_786899 [Zopfia rhizophila CBS 207.26]